MTWNYRVVRRAKDGHTWFALHEVHYDQGGRPRAMTAEPAGFIADVDEGPSGIVRALGMALADASRRPVLDEASELPSPVPQATIADQRVSPLAALDRLMDAKAGTPEAEWLTALATAIEDRENLVLKLAQLYQAIGHLIDGRLPSEAEMQRLLDYAEHTNYDPEFLPWPRMTS